MRGLAGTWLSYSTLSSAGLKRRPMNQASTPRAGTKRAHFRELLVNLSLLATVVIVLLAACEMFLRFFEPGYLSLDMNIFQFDRHGILDLKPNAVRQHRTSDWDVRVITNAEGLRDRPTPLPADGGTVLGIGDSMAFGWGVELPLTYYYRLEEALRPDRVRVIKAGIPGTGTTDQLKWLQHYGEHHRPEVVILSFYVGND